MIMDRHVYAIEALQPDDAHDWRLLARSDRSFETLAQRACRFGYLAASLHCRLDPEAARGLVIREADALLALARSPAASLTQSRTKAALFRSYRERNEHESNVVAMLRVACSLDAIGLASAHGSIGFAGGCER